MSEFVGFLTWDAVIEHVEAGKPTYYQAPMNVRPTRVNVKLSERRKVRITAPVTADWDSFTADSAHLDRFKKRA